MNMQLSDLVGMTMNTVAQVDDTVVFFADTGRKFRLYHEQNCCESVTVEDICGDLADLQDAPILQADESTSNTNPEGVTEESDGDFFTWTFYRFATIKGAVTIRFYGESNGYYSESVEFEEAA